MMNRFDDEIDWSKTTVDGSRSEQLRRWRALNLQQRLEALDEMSELAERLARSQQGKTTERKAPRDRD